MHRDVDAQGFFAPGLQIKGSEGQPGAPGVVQRAPDTAFLADAHQLAQIRKFQRHRAGCFEPDEACLRTDLGCQILRVHRVVIAMADAPGHEFTLRQDLVRAIGIVRNQHLIAAAQKRQRHIGYGGESTGQQQALQSAFQRAKALFQRVGRGRAVQAVGVGALVFPVKVAHRRNMGKDHRRCLENARLRRGEPFRRAIGMMYQCGVELGHGALRAQTLHFCSSCSGLSES